LKRFPNWLSQGRINIKTAIGPTIIIIVVRSCYHFAWVRPCKT